MTSETLAEAARGHFIARWDLDKTYLRTEFDTMRDLVRTAIERPDRKRSLHGVVDYWKDYADVYRVQVPPHRTLHLTLTMQRGTNPDLAVYSNQGRSIYKTRGRLAWSSNRAGKTERITIRNASRRAQTAYAAVYSPTAQDARYDAPYTLSVKR